MRFAGSSPALRAFASSAFAPSAFGLFALAASALVAPAAAETINEALAAAYLGNPTLQAQRANVRATDEQVPEALGGWRPTITVTGDVGKEKIDSESSTGFGADQTITPRSVAIAVVQPLYRGGRTVNGVRRAEHLVEADRARLHEVEQQILLDAATAYMDVLRDKAVLELAINNEHRLQRDLEATQDRFEVGEVTRTDVEQAKSRLSAAVAERVRARGDLRTTRATYAKIVGNPPAQLTAASPLAALPASEEEARTIALAEHPSIRRADFAEKAARADLRIAIGVLLPEARVRGSYSKAEETSTFIDSQDTGTLTAELTVPLYQSGAEYAQVRAARQVASARRLELEEARRQVLEGVSVWWEAWTTAKAQISAFSDNVRAAAVALDGVRQEAAVGTRTTLDVLDAENELFNARVDLVRSRRDAVVASYGLMAAIGRLTAEDLALPVEVYDPAVHYQAVRGKLFGLGEE